MNEKPILFNTPMVRAILEGRKTQTRRLIKEIALCAPYCEVYDGKLTACDENGEWHPAEEFCRARPGDVLWVRETWANLPVSPGGHTRLMNGVYYYKADDPDLRPERWKETPWRPSIHMPKAAARIFLRVEDVRAEQLQRIDKEGITAEGIIIHHTQETARQAFAGLWDSTVTPEKLATGGWAANPWVWVYTFQRVEKPEGWETK